MFQNQKCQHMNRRQFLTTTVGALASCALKSNAAAAAESAAAAPLLKGKAEHCIFIWLGGGMAQVDTFDPKRLGDPRTRSAGSAYEAIPTAVPGVNVCRFLPRVARLMERLTVVRTVHHEVIDEHAAATQRVHTG